jgi:hypothetical protein
MGAFVGRGFGLVGAVQRDPALICGPCADLWPMTAGRSASSSRLTLTHHPTHACLIPLPQAKEMNGGKNLPLWQKAACGLSAGGIGALVGTPADLSLIRMQADTTLPPEQRRNYKGVVDAMVRALGGRGGRGLAISGVGWVWRAWLGFRSECGGCVAHWLAHPDPRHLTLSQTRIVRDDGVAGLFRGGGPTVVRAMALNMGMLASNDQVRGPGGPCSESYCTLSRCCA